MPISADPEKIFKLTLQSDLAKPETIRPTFNFRYLTSREWRRCAEFQEEMEEITRPTEIVDKVFQYIKIGLVGWDNMFVGDPDIASGAATPYDPEKLIDIITIFEAQELLAKILGASPNAGPSVADKKKLELRSDAATDQSAPDDAEG